ncbi:MAG: QueT transporter family protein [Anaerovoracaceae bacterium]|jgi:uncharacterized membrane protein
MKRGFHIKFLIQASVIAALYVVLTITLMPISYGFMQVRVSEALTVLPYFTPAAIPGLFIGCLISNALSPYGIVDMICGSGATLLAALTSYLVRRNKYIVPLPPILYNGLIIGGMLYFVYGVPISLPICMLWVSAGEFLACYLIGMPLLLYLEKRNLFHGERIG